MNIFSQNIAVFVAGLAVFLAPFALGQQETGKVVFNHNPKTGELNGIVIKPGAKLSKDDESKLNSVLNNYDKQLYRIEHRQDDKHQWVTDGKLVDQEKSIANKGLTNIYIDQSIKSEVANAKAAGVTDYMLVCIIGYADSAMPLENMAKGKEMNKQLLKELTPILKKYAAP